MVALYDWECHPQRKINILCEEVISVNENKTVSGSK